ncbi:hypothetical protein KCU81_g457, partial [Aureobasidium melanogenum]
LLIIELELTHELFGLLGGFLKGSVIALSHFTTHVWAAASEGSARDQGKVQQRTHRDCSISTTQQRELYEYNRRDRPKVAMLAPYIHVREIDQIPTYSVSMATWPSRDSQCRTICSGYSSKHPDTTITHHLLGAQEMITVTVRPNGLAYLVSDVPIKLRCCLTSTSFLCQQDDPLRSSPVHFGAHTAVSISNGISLELRARSQTVLIAPAGQAGHCHGSNGTNRHSVVLN